MDTPYPRPAPFTWPKVTPRTLLPIYPPPENLLKYPQLPSPPRKPIFSTNPNVLYTLSTHIIPAAHLRMSRDFPIPDPIPHTLPRAEKAEQAEKLRQYIQGLRKDPTPAGVEKVLWNCINRYVRNDLGTDGSGKTKEKGITLFLAHANGFPKEIWEPTLGHLLSSPAAEHIDEVWAWEAVQHGDSVLLNDGSLSAVSDWTDNTRDILNFLLHFLPSTASSASLPIHLPRVSPDETQYRKVNGFRERTFVTVGHSFGGCTSAIAAAHYPRLFTSLILIDPVILEPDLSSMPVNKHSDNLAHGALQRRETWKSREEALSLFEKSPFFQAWDPSSVKVYVECGLYNTSDDPNSPVRLKMSGVQEAIVFSENIVGWEGWQHASTVDPKVEIRWLLPGKPESYDFGPPGAAQRRAWLRPANCSNTRIPTAGHLIPQEAPRELALDLQNFILDRFGPPNTRRAAL